MVLKKRGRQSSLFFILSYHSILTLIVYHTFLKMIIFIYYFKITISKTLDNKSLFVCFAMLYVFGIAAWIIRGLGMLPKNEICVKNWARSGTLAFSFMSIILFRHAIQYLVDVESLKARAELMKEKISSSWGRGLLLRMISQPSTHPQQVISWSTDALEDRWGSRTNKKGVEVFWHCSGCIAWQQDA